MEEEQKEQQDALAALNWSVLFLLLLIAGMLLSFAATTTQRDGLIRSLLCGSTQEEPDVFPLRWRAGVLTAAAVGFFAYLSRRSLDQAMAGEDCAQQRSAKANALASALVFAAVLIRLDDLESTAAGRCSAVVEQTPAPE